MKLMLIKIEHSSDPQNQKWSLGHNSVQEGSNERSCIGKALAEWRRSAKGKVARWIRITANTPSAAEIRDALLSQEMDPKRQRMSATRTAGKKS